MQFPQNFHRTVVNRRVLRDTVEDFKAVPLAVEFRHGSWDHPATYEGLRERGLMLVVPDMPPLGIDGPSRIRVIPVRLRGGRQTR